MIRRAGAHAGRSDEGSGRFVRAFGQAARRPASLRASTEVRTHVPSDGAGNAVLPNAIFTQPPHGVLSQHTPRQGASGAPCPASIATSKGRVPEESTFDRAGGSTTSAPPTAKAIAMAASPSGADTSEAAGAAAAPVCACPGCAFAAPAPTSAAITRMAAASNGARRRVRDIRWRMYRPPAAIQGRALPHSSRCRDREGEGEDRERFRECGFQDTQRGIVRPSPASPERLGRRHRLPSCRRFEQ